MSYNIGAIAVKANINEVTKTTFEFFNQKGTLHQIENIPNNENHRVPDDVVTGSFIVNNINDWTIIAFSQVGIFPQLEVYLSEKLSTKVIAIDINETVEYRHFSVLENGIPNMIYTIGLKDGEISENLNVDFEFIFKLASSNPAVYRLAKGTSVDEIQYYAYDIFNVLISEINLEALSVNLFENDDSKYYLYTTKYNRLSYSELNWQEIVHQNK